MKEYWTDLTSGQKTKLVLKIVLGLFALIFAVRNWQSTEVVLIFFKVNMPLTVLILACLAIGFALASLFDYRKFKAKDKEITDLKEKMKTLLNPSNEEK
ncbi:MAG: LapA family protein [Crocinitomicaceae bacterium]